jgi:V8-like Glu-specific endopeptidase
MRKLRLVLVAFATMAAMVYAGSAAAPATAHSAASEHQRIIDFWTPARVAQAVPRDFVFNPGTQRFEIAQPTKGKPGGGGGGGHGGGGNGGGGNGDTIGSSWNKGGDVAKTTGKVLFAMGGSYYVCSASVVTDDASGRSLVLTAGHCVYDETNRAFATNWMFIPDYDAAPARLTSSDSFCADTAYGCWTAEYLTVDAGFANAGGFNTQATLNDVGFAVLGTGGSNNDLVESEVGTQGISFSEGALGYTAWLFGYPAAQKYKGTDLIYCRGPLGTDPLNSNLTYRVDCNMTGGSSGGPWFQPFTEASGSGTLMSVNSYGYSGVTAMHGPMFGSWTKSVFDAAEGASGNTIVGVTVTAP